MTAISVTAEHIAEGIREDCERCPVALAIADAFPDLTYVRVGPDNIGVQRGVGEFQTLLAVPPDAQNFIWDFDDGATPDPFTFDLNYPAVTA
jgi:hypothetical protein